VKWQKSAVCVCDFKFVCVRFCHGTILLRGSIIYYYWPEAAQLFVLVFFGATFSF
jgi:hypothetical protein